MQASRLHLQPRRLYHDHDPTRQSKALTPRTGRQSSTVTRCQAGFRSPKLKCCFAAAAWNRTSVRTGPAKEMNQQIRRGSIRGVQSAATVERWCARPSRGGCCLSRGKQRVDETIRIEQFEVVDLLADSHILDGDTHCLADGDHDTAFGGAVQFRQHDAGTINGF